MVRLRRALTDSYWLGTEILGYDRLSKEFHAPMMADMDRRDRQRALVRAARREYSKAAPELWPDLHPHGLHEYTKDEAEFWARDHYKTTVFIVRCARMILMWPDVAISAWHCVESKIQETSEELGNIFLKNDEFRRLMPDIMPAKQMKRFLTAEGFTVKRTRYRRHKTFYAKGAGAEVGGGHSDLGWLDDIEGQSTVDNSDFPRLARWIGHTVSHVVRTDGGWLWGTGTFWPGDDAVYGAWLSSPQWDCRVRPALETAGKMDYKGTPVLYDQRWIDKKRDDPQTNFPLQMMLDRQPEGETKWSTASEQYCALESRGGIPGAMEGQGVTVVLSDPAPWKAGGWKGLGEKNRADGTKDWWSIAALRVRVRGMLWEVILLDGRHSLEWGEEQGCDQACELMKRWRTPIFVSEDPAAWHDRMIAAARRNAVALRRAKDGGPLRYEVYNQSNRKNQSFSALADLNSNGQFYILETCSQEFLHGDQQHTGFLTQARKWRNVGPGKNALRFDDDADCVARVTDPLIREISPRSETETESIMADQFSPFRRQNQSPYTWGVRHVRA